jgi:uncharacterized protein YjiS (DUF1127 family)
MKLIQFSNTKRLLYRIMQQLELYSQRSRTRKYLLEMDAQSLKDVGLTQQQALQEGKRFFWQGENPSSTEVCKSEVVSDKGTLIKPGQRRELQC